jgi:hypothetical protein
MRCHTATISVGKNTRQPDGVSFDGEVKVIDGATQHEVPHRASHYIERETACCRVFCNPAN